LATLLDDDDDDDFRFEEVNDDLEDFLFFFFFGCLAGDVGVTGDSRGWFGDAAVSVDSSLLFWCYDLLVEVFRRGLSDCRSDSLLRGLFHRWTLLLLLRSEELLDDDMPQKSWQTAWIKWWKILAIAVVIQLDAIVVNCYHRKSGLAGITSAVLGFASRLG
jgi:hypothetical protein